MPFSIRGRETSSPTCGTPGGAFLNSAAREQGRAGLRAHGTQDMSWSEVHLKRSSLRVSELLFHEGVSVGVVRRTISFWQYTLLASSLNLCKYSHWEELSYVG